MADDLITAHKLALERFRGSMNLVGPGPIQTHYDDATAALDGLAPVGRWVDLGTGAGFPGIIFAHLFPAVNLELVDSRRKRCWFVEHAIAQAQVQRAGTLDVRCQRVESLDDAVYDGIISRAFAPPPKVLEHARRLLKPGGQVLLLLQDDARIDVPDDFTTVKNTPYTVDFKRRRSQLLLWKP